MCIRVGNDELASVRALMTMTLNVLISEALSVDVDDISPEAELVDTLHMTAESEQDLVADIEDMFDGLVIDMQHIKTVADLMQVVVENEFTDLAA